MVLDPCEDAFAVNRESSVPLVQVLECREIDTDVLNITGVLSADLFEKCSHVLSSAYTEVEVVSSVEQRTSFAIDLLLCDQKPYSRRFVW